MDAPSDGCFRYTLIVPTEMSTDFLHEKLVMQNPLCLMVQTMLYLKGVLFPSLATLFQFDQLLYDDRHGTAQQKTTELSLVKYALEMAPKLSTANSMCDI